MRKYYSAIVFVLLFTTSKAQFVTIPDNDFRSFLQNKYPACFDAGGLMNTTCPAIVQEESLLIRLNTSNYINLSGIQYFTSLTHLDFSNNAIATAPALPASLKYLRMVSTSPEPGVNFFPVMPAGLLYLDCSSNYLSGFSSPLPSALRYLNCAGNSLEAPDFSALPAGLDTFFCSGQITVATFSHILRSLPVLPPSLKYLDCSFNGLNSLPALPASLRFLDCSSQDVNISPEAVNRTLSSLPALPQGLTYLNCSGNRLSSLPALPSSLVYLDCSSEYDIINTFPPPPDPFDYTLGLLPALPNSLQQLICDVNKLQCLPRLPFTLSTLVYDADRIPCLPNNCLAAQGAAICDAATNVNQCAAFPVIKGNVFTDNNTNSIKDAGEYGRRNVKVYITNNNAYTFTDNNGNYALSADSIGLYAVMVDAPDYFNPQPAATSFIFSRYDTIVTANFALQAASVYDSLNISIAPITNIARPGGTLVYRISYENAGNRSLSPAVSFSYDNSKLTYDSSSNAAVINGGTALTLAAGSMAAGKNDFFTAYFKVKTTVVMGDAINSVAVISSGIVVGRDSNSIIARASYDPNDKQATAQLTPAQVSSGKYVDYTIRFQNTGTDSALNVVISDTINSQLLLSSFELINTSHTCTVSAKDNVLFFEFKNIRLPDSNVNELKSHGFVQFRIKPQPGIALNTVITNSGNIYFDYNYPVTTNTAYTAIKNPGQVYVFTGDGNWNAAANWKNNIVPPASVPQNEIVIVDPSAGSCILNTPVTFLQGSALSVQQNKKFVVQGNLTVH